MLKDKSILRNEDVKKQNEKEFETTCLQESYEHMCQLKWL